MLSDEDFARGIAPMLAEFHKEAVPPEKLAVMHMLCAHLPAAIFAGAVLEVLSGPTYGFPKSGDILEAAVRVVMAQRDLSEAWARQELYDLWARHQLALAGGQALQLPEPE